MFELRQYQPDPVRIVLERNEELLWRIYLFYSYNAVVVREILTGSMKGGSAAVQAKLKPMPVFKSTFRYEKRLLHQDDLWQLLNDFALVPAVVNTIRFNKLISEMVIIITPFLIRTSPHFFTPSHPNLLTPNHPNLLTPNHICSLTHPHLLPHPHVHLLTSSHKPSLIPIHLPPPISSHPTTCSPTPICSPPHLLSHPTTCSSPPLRVNVVTS